MGPGAPDTRKWGPGGSRDEDGGQAPRVGAGGRGLLEKQQCDQRTVSSGTGSFLLCLRSGYTCVVTPACGGRTCGVMVGAGRR